MRLISIIAAALITSSAAAHELTPTYPEIESAYVDGVSVIKMKMWNRRDDASYYEVSVYDGEWKPVPFATPERVIKLEYLEHKSFELYIRDADRDKIKYICTISKQLKQDVQSTGIKSRICSKVK